MFGENKIYGPSPEPYGLFPPQNHFFLVPDTVLPTPNQPWNMPIFYGFRSLEILPPPNPATLPTSH
jgi:hypothetical protein